MKINIRLIYLYLFSFVGLLIIVIGSVRMVDLGLKAFVFTQADKYEIYPMPADERNTVSVDEQIQRQERDLSRQRQRELTGALSMLVVGIPLYIYHWKTIQKENKD